MTAGKYLVVYYSRTGTTRQVAVALARALHCDIEAIVDTQDRAGIFGYLRSAWAVLRKRGAVIAAPKRDVSMYELVIVGTPVWAGRVSTPVRSYLMAQKKRLPMVAFFCTLGGRGDESTFAEMRQLIEKNPCAQLACTTAEVENGRYLKPLQNFVKAVATHLKLHLAAKNGQQNDSRHTGSDHMDSHHIASQYDGDNPAQRHLGSGVAAEIRIGS